MTDETEIPQPYQIAEDLARLRANKNTDSRIRAYCDIGLMLYWCANEINNLVVILQPNALPLQDDPETVPSESPSEDAEGAEGRPMDADEERQIEGSD